MGRRILIMAACAAVLAQAKPRQQSVQVVTSDHADYNGGTIRVNNSYGEVAVEAWDAPGVQVTVTRTTFRRETPKDQEAGKAYLNRIKVSLEKSQNGDLEISTKYPGRNRLMRTIHGLGDFTMDYRIQVPRNAKVTVQHGVGDVLITGVVGDIDATIRTGDIVLQLPEPEKYAIDARSSFGTIYTDFEGTQTSPLLVGQKLEGGGGHKLHLRALLGGISIQKIPPTPRQGEPGS